MVRAELLPQRGCRSGYAEHRPPTGTRQRVSSCSHDATQRIPRVRSSHGPDPHLHIVGRLMDRLRDRVILITGSTGIAAATAAR